MTNAASEAASPKGEKEKSGPKHIPELCRESRVPLFAGIALCLLLAVAQMALGGYQVGVGNQSIQMAFLKKAADPQLFATDRMVSETMPLYPTYFFRMLAPLLRWTDVGTLYLYLQIITGFLTLAAVYWLSRSIFRMHTAGLAAVALLAAGHLRALAGDGLYSQGFTHTYAALPLAIAVLALAFGGRREGGRAGGGGGGWGATARWIGAFALAGVLFNVHALTAAYVLLMLGAGLFAELWELPLWKWLGRALLCGAAAELLAAPTLWLMVRNRQVFGDEWLNLMRIRSAEHSFPSTWWVPGDPDIPRFILLFALFVMSWSFAPVRRGTGPEAGRLDGSVRRAARMTVLMTLAVAALFAAGFLLTEVWPPKAPFAWLQPLIIRLQPFRASRLLMILMLVHIAHGAVVAMRAGISGKTTASDGTPFRLTGPVRVLEIAGGALILATLGLPWLMPLLPLTVALALVGALWAGHLSWKQGVVGVVALLVAVLGNRQIGFPLPLVSQVSWWPRAAEGANVGLGLVALLTGGAMAAVLAMLDQRWARGIVTALSMVLGMLLASGLYVRERGELPAGNGRDLADAAAWARRNTNRSAVFLTPTGFGNFRVMAERSLVGDWRDGTQLYFDAGFAAEWWARASAIEPGLVRSEDRRRLESRGVGLETLGDKALLDLAKRYDASYIVLPTPTAEHARTLMVAYKGRAYTVYEPRPIRVATEVPAGVVNPTAWNEMEAFMRAVVQPNIERYRKADVAIELVDGAGQPVQEWPVKFEETKSAFAFGGSLGYFEPVDDTSADGDMSATVVRPIELEKFPEVFNGSLIPFSAKWAAIEPQRGVYRWSELDKYVNYCTLHDITMELHHLTGVRPVWVAEMGGPSGTSGLSFGRVIPALQQEFNRHCLAVVDRYHDRIKYIQVENEKYMMQYVPEAWKLLKTKYPDVLFGLSDCTNFYVRDISNPSYYEAYDMKGFDAIGWLRNRGIQPDFFSMHGHHPSNYWADPRDMYAILNKFRDINIRVHISEEYLRLNGPISGNVRTGTLTPELQAEYLERYFTVCFSHPSVDMVNLWGALAPYGWSNSGLIDSQNRMLPGFARLKKLFRETWWSRVSTQSPLDGIVKARVFHGKYRLTVTLPNGKEASATLEVPEKEEARFKVKVNAAQATLEVLK